MDKNTSNVIQNAGGNNSTKSEDENAPRRELNSMLEELKESADEGAKEALKAPVSKKEIEACKRLIKEQKDTFVGDDLNDLLEHIVEVVEKHPNELVLTRILWVITLLGSPKCLGGFGKSLLTLAMIKSLASSEE